MKMKAWSRFTRPAQPAFANVIDTGHVSAPDLAPTYMNKFDAPRHLMSRSWHRDLRVLGLSRYIAMAATSAQKSERETKILCTR